MLPERFQCPRCEKHFGHQQILQLHLRVHESNGDAQLKPSQKAKEDVRSEKQNEGQLSKKSSCTLTNNERLQSSTPSKDNHLLLAKPSPSHHATWLHTLLHFSIDEAFINLVYLHPLSMSVNCVSHLQLNDTQSLINHTRYALIPNDGKQPVGTREFFQRILCDFTCNITLDIAHMSRNLLFKNVFWGCN
jgi:hypothetical protein